MGDNIVMTASKDGVTLEVKYDSNAQSPREWDNLGTMICFHSRHSLGDEHCYKDVDAFLFSLLEDTLGDTEEAEKKVASIEESIDRGVYKQSNFWREVNSKMLDIIKQKHVILPLYLYDHSGITMSTTRFSCSWDSGQVGWIYASHERIEKEYKKLDTESLEDTRLRLMSEVKDYDNYILSNCYYYRLVRDRKVVYFTGDIEGELLVGKIEELDSCSGFLCELSDIKSELLDTLGDEYKHLVDLLEYC